MHAIIIQGACICLWFSALWLQKDPIQQFQPMPEGTSANIFFFLFVLVCNYLVVIWCGNKIILAGGKKKSNAGFSCDNLLSKLWADNAKDCFKREIKAELSYLEVHPSYRNLSRGFKPSRAMWVIPFLFHGIRTAALLRVVRVRATGWMSAGKHVCE